MFIRISVIRPVRFCRFCERALVRLKNHEIGRVTKTCAQWCTSWPRLAQGLRSKPSHQSKGGHVPLRWCGSRGSSPVLEIANRGCSTPFFGGSGSWNHKPSGRGIVAAVRWLKRLCFALVTNEVSIESPKTPSSLRMVGSWLGGQQSRRTCHPVGAIKTLPRFDGVDEIAVKAIILIVWYL